MKDDSEFLVISELLPCKLSVYVEAEDIHPEECVKKSELHGESQDFALGSGHQTFCHPVGLHHNRHQTDGQVGQG